MAIKIERDEEVYVPKWNGNDALPPEQQIRMSYRRVTVKDFFRLQRSAGVNLMTGMAVNLESIEAIDRHWSLMEAVIATQATAFSGIEIAGKAITDPAQVVERLGYGYLGLIAECVSEIMANAVGTADDAKNSSPDSEPPKAESGTPA